MRFFTCFLLLLFIGQFANSQIASRLVAWTSYYPQYYSADSETYNYTGHNGGDLNHPLKYSTSGSYVPGGNSLFGYSWQTFDNFDNIASQTIQDDDGGSLVNEENYLYYYDANHNDTVNIFQSWDNTNVEWQNSTKQMIFYNGNGKDTTIIDQQWNTSYWSVYYNQWENDFKYVSSYDSNNNLISEDELIWNGQQWVQNDMTIFSYDKYDNLSSELYLGWINGTWSDTNSWYKYTYNYDTRGLDTLEYSLEYINTQWDSIYKIYYHYNQGNNLSSQVEFTNSQDTGSAIWVRYDSTAYSYNNYDNLSSVLVYNWQSLWIKSESQQYNTFSQLTSDSNYFSETWNKYYYSTYDSGFKATTIGRLLLFPNPSSGYINFNIELYHTSGLQLFLINIFGQVVWQRNINSISDYSGNIPVENLPDGTYILEMQTSYGIQGEKVQVVR